MTDVVAVGSSAFILGFSLAGIKTVLAQSIDDIPKDAGLVIIDEKLVENLNVEQRTKLETSISPLVITLQADQERLRRAVKRTLGVDLL